KVKGVGYPIFVGVVEHGALKRSDYQINHTGKGLIKVASYNGDQHMLSCIVDAFDKKSFPFYMITDWDLMLKEKLIVNAVINPLTALFQVKNGSILKIAHMETLAYLLCKEAASVLE